MLTPKTRLEKWLAKIAGESVEIEPKDRLETLLAKIAGDSVTITPDDSLEYWLNEIAENGGGGGSSDFSTAKMTVNVTYPEEYYTLIISGNPRDQEVTSLIFTNNGLLKSYEVADAETENLDVLLYNGEGRVTVLGDEISVSGNATLEGYVVTFTGDFTINATAVEP